MSKVIGTPVNQKRLTNVSIVRLMKTGKRFEIACYCNKVESYRKGIETDMTEVMQSEFVFTNVSKGAFASSKELKKAFGTDDILSVQRVILADGELQLTAKERQAHTESTFRDIATIISEKCVNPTNSRPYIVSTILSALRDDLKYGLIPGRSAKQQSLDLIKKLQAVIPIARAKMLVRIHDITSSVDSEKLDDILNSLDGCQKGEGVDYFIEPDIFKVFSAHVAKFSGGVEVVQLSVVSDTTPCEATPERADKNEAAEEEEDSSTNIEKDHQKKEKNSGSRKSKAAKRREKEEVAAKMAAKEEVRQKQEARANKIKPMSSEDSDLPPPVSPSIEKTDSGISAIKSCTTCLGSSFKTAAEHRAHFKTNWHTFNLKLKMAKQPVVSEAEFLAVDAEDFF